MAGGGVLFRHRALWGHYREAALHPRLGRMGPFSAWGQSAEGPVGRGITKMRKPVVEKMRRDRINSSIEQLRLLLEKELQGHQLPSKAEKADILEMAVRSLSQRQQPPAPAMASREGYSRCLQDSLHFLSLHAPKETQLKLLRELHRPAAEGGAHSLLPSCPTSTKQPAQDSPKALWRPW